MHFTNEPPRNPPAQDSLDSALILSDQGEPPSDSPEPKADPRVLARWAVFLFLGVGLTFWRYQASMDRQRRIEDLGRDVHVFTPAEQEAITDALEKGALEEEGLLRADGGIDRAAVEARIGEHEQRLRQMDDAGVPEDDQVRFDLSFRTGLLRQALERAGNKAPQRRPAEPARP